ncbi:hypothetical protein U5A82_18370 [Sphingobium sp. CR2-8]|uniref:hypothetical protein n=1 Tax=Sphingobium sp. CR2-8 TaxID=1306534 RepID=UPI002DB562B4|nr:hypothetical protein [Sphingobium sp. CR2-8]MEC3912367.1 hypothetical protein [Sphingobium sp. CR2-8]
MVSGGWIMMRGVSSARAALQYPLSHQGERISVAGQRRPCRDGPVACGLVSGMVDDHYRQGRQHQYDGQDHPVSERGDEHAAIMAAGCLRQDERYGCGLFGDE